MQANIRTILTDLILEMDRPFSLSTLFDVAAEKKIYNKELILDVLEELCDSGLVDYSDIEDHEFISRFALSV